MKETMMERYTEYHAGVPVLKDKDRMKEAMARFAEREERDTAKKPELINGIAVCPKCGTKGLWFVNL